MSESFSYRPLPGPKHFRLVEVQAAAFAHPIQCKISDYAIHGATRYEALSYAWGPHVGNGPFIELNGAAFQISIELELAIRRLRYTNSARTLWIDAICINQTDTRERNAQVGLMRNIYRDAGRVVVWLGDESDSSRRALRFLKEMAILRDPDGAWKYDAQQPGPSSGGDDSENERSYFDWNAQAREIEDDFLGTTDSETDVGAEEDDPLVPKGDAADRPPKTLKQHLQRMIISIKKRWRKLVWDLRWKWRNRKRIVQSPIEALEDNRVAWKRWQVYLDEVYADNDDDDAADFDVTDLPSPYYTLGHQPDGLFTDSRQSDWEALDSLFQRPWFSRTWVLQEVWNATACIIQCGRSTLKLRTFARAMDFENEWDYMGYRVQETKRWEIWPSLKKRYELAIQIAKRKPHGSHGRRLSDLLWSAWGREATDPKDKVFALYGINGNAQLGSLTKANYFKPLRDVYKDTAVQIIRKDNNLNLLLAASGSTRPKELPSWVPDWRKAAHDQRPAPFVQYAKLQDLMTQTGSQEMARLHGHAYSAAAKFEPGFSFSDDLSVLNISGFVVGRILHTGPVSEEDMDAEVILARARAAITHFESFSTPTRSSSSILPDDGDLRRILRGGAPIPIKNRYEYEYGGDEDRVIENMMRNRRFFLTEDGHPCIGPAQAREGDLVVVIAGCFYPMVLRPQGERYTLIGEAYGRPPY